ncbi:MAG: Nramp family divalent metal transporter [Pseudomonadota bacterium]
MSKAAGQRLQFGPGLLVTAAFIGPGTVTTASAAGANFGFALAWALLFSVFATAVLQEMAARVGLVTRQSLAEAMRASFGNPLFGRLAVVLVVAAIGLGNAAYEAGNIAGAALALTSLGGPSVGLWSLVIGAVAGALMLSGRYHVVERVLICLVLLMSAIFLISALLLRPDWGALLVGLRPQLPAGSALTALALIGTTVVPYNLFLHANAVREKWGAERDTGAALRASRLDTNVSIGLGGLLTLAIMSTAMTAFFATGQAYDIDSLSTPLRPLLGDAAAYVYAAGLFAGGLTSAITAPMAAGYAVSGAFGWRTTLDAPGFRLVALAVLLTGVAFAATGSRPLAAILFAQAANGFLLPVIAVFLLIVMNRKSLLGDYRNTPLANLAGGLVVLVAAWLGISKIVSIFL